MSTSNMNFTGSSGSGSSSNGEVTVVYNYINGKFVEPSKATTNNDDTNYLNVTNPSNGCTIGKVYISNEDDVNDAIESAANAFPNWYKNYTIKSRATIIYKFHQLVQEHSMELAELIVKENGKNIIEALADIAKGNETVEYAASIANNSMLGSGKILPVSSNGNIICEDRKLPIGVVVSIVPFNFPFMVPMWTIPIALVLGNTVILKPSEKVPLTIHRTMALWKQAGLPSGCLNIVHGTRPTVEALIQHPNVQAVTFVGSSPVAASIAQQCASHTNKRCIALGGAKNHLIALSDCDINSTAQDIVTSFCGCAGQRCMAASVLLLVNNIENDEQLPAQQISSSSSSSSKAALVDKDGGSIHVFPSHFVKLVETIRSMAQKLKPGNKSGEMGPVIDHVSYNKIISYIDNAIKINGAQVLLDGRNNLSYTEMGGEGCWIGPTILYHHNSTDHAMVEEIFGPVLSIYQCNSWKEAIDIENTSPYGNAASIYTKNGGHAQYFLSHCKATMLGCNIGIPVPREPFSFGGLYGTKSKYGNYPGDITGDSAIEFFTNRIKVTSKWPTTHPTLYDTNVTSNGTNKEAKLSNDDSTTTAAAAAATSTDTVAIDHASFAGRM